MNTNYKNFAPRIGFSASATNKTVVHGAFGLSFFPADTQNTILGSNPPFTSSFSASPLTLDSGNIFYLYFGDLPAPASPGTDLSKYSGNLYTKPKSYPSSYMEEFNLGIQQQIGQNVLSISYVGELGRRLNLSGNYNVSLPAPYSLPNPQTRAPYASTIPEAAAIYALSGGDPDLDRGRRDGHAARLSRAQRPGADGARTAAAVGPCVCFSRPAGRHFEVPLVRRRRIMPAVQAAGTWTLRVAQGDGRNGLSYPPSCRCFLKASTGERLRGRPNLL